MDSVNPNPTPIDLNNLDPNTRYALDVERRESFTNQFGVLGTDRAVYDHAKTLVNQPQDPGAMKMLTGEMRQRRWAYFDLPQYDSRVFIYDSPNYSTERLEANVQMTMNLDCSCDNKEEQTMREQEQAVIHSFCVNQLKRKLDYDHLRARIIEFLQG